MVRSSDAVPGFSPRAVLLPAVGPGERLTIDDGQQWSLTAAGASAFSWEAGVLGDLPDVQ